MTMTDPIADLATRIRNANRIRRDKVDAPYYKIKEGILRVLKDEGYIKDYTIFGEGKMKTLRTFLKYGPQREFIIGTIRRDSTPGRRIYKNVADLDPVVDGMGISILTTPRGVLSDRECRKQNVGGEILLSDTEEELLVRLVTMVGEDRAAHPAGIVESTRRHAVVDHQEVARPDPPDGLLDEAGHSAAQLHLLTGSEFPTSCGETHLQFPDERTGGRTADLHQGIPLQADASWLARFNTGISKI